MADNKISIAVDRDLLIRALQGNAYNRTIFQKESAGPDKTIHTDTITVDSSSGKTILTLEVKSEKPEPDASVKG